MDGQSIQIASCDEEQIERITVSAWSDVAGRWIPLWESEGDPLDSSGLIISVGDPPQGWTSVTTVPDSSALLSAGSLSVKLWHSATGALSEVFDATKLTASWASGDGSPLEPHCLEERPRPFLRERDG